MVIQKTLVVIKPDAVKRRLVGQIVTRFEEKGFQLLELRLYLFSKRGGPRRFMTSTGRKISSGASFIHFVWENYGLYPRRKRCNKCSQDNDRSNKVLRGISRVRSRGDFGLGLTDNIIHASDTHESFIKESKVIFGSS